MTRVMNKKLDFREVTYKLAYSRDSENKTIF